MKGQAKPSQRGLTLVEAVIATSVVALLASAAGGAAHVILRADQEAQGSWEATELGVALLQEIACLPFNDPQDGGTGIAVESGEFENPWTRVNLDDVDDYVVWDGSYPLQQKDGTAINMPGYTRSVAIDYVAEADFTSVSGTPTDYKRIRVNVFHDGTLVRTVETVRVEGGRYVDFDG